MVKILIVEDQTLLRESIKNLINAQQDMKTIGETDDAAVAPELCRTLKPDLVLMDVVTKDRHSGLKYTAEIHSEFPEIKIVVMTSLPEITFADEAKKAGAHSFLNKEMNQDHLLNTIRTTMQGFSTYSFPSDRLPFKAQLTEKEIAVLRLVCQGLSRKEIAEKLGIAEVTTKQHISSILDKTGFDSISKFAIYAVDEGFIKPLD